MTKINKLIERFSSIPSDFTWDELIRLLRHFGYQEYKRKGKTAGSRNHFVNAENRTIRVHRPHPNNAIKKYVIRSIIKELKIK